MIYAKQKHFNEFLNSIEGINPNTLSTRLRMGPKRYEDALALPHARPKDFTGRTIKGFVHVDSKGRSKDATLKKWLHRVLTTPLHFPRK